MADLSIFLFELIRPSRTLVLYAILFAFIFIGCAPALDGPGGQPVESSSTGFRVATSGDYEPFSAWPTSRGRLEASAPSGFSVDVAKAYAADHGKEIEWVRFRWADLASSLETERFDFALSGITVRPDRSMLGRFSLPLTISRAVALVPADSRFRTAADLDHPSVSLAVNAGGHLEKVARRLFPSARIEAMTTNSAVLPRLLRSEVDAVVSDDLEAPHWRRAAGTTMALRTIGPLTRDRKAAWFPRSREALAHRFDRWLIEAESSGLLDRLRSRYGLSRIATARPEAALLASLDERLSLMPEVAMAKSVLALPIEDRVREERVLRAAGLGVIRAAGKAGVVPPDPIAVERLFRAQIEAAKWIQRQTLANAAESPMRSTSDLRRDARAEARSRLDETLRPALLYLGDRIAMLVVAAIAQEAPATLDRGDIARALMRHRLPPSHLRELHRALEGILKNEIEDARTHPRPREERDRATSASAQRTPP